MLVSFSENMYHLNTASLQELINARAHSSEENTHNNWFLFFSFSSSDLFHKSLWRSSSCSSLCRWIARNKRKFVTQLLYGASFSSSSSSFDQAPPRNPLPCFISPIRTRSNEAHRNTKGCFPNCTHERVLWVGNWNFTLLADKPRTHKNATKTALQFFFLFHSRHPRPPATEYWNF